MNPPAKKPPPVSNPLRKDHFVEDLKAGNMKGASKGNLEKGGVER
jgi:hypothetical protein